MKDSEGYTDRKAKEGHTKWPSFAFQSVLFIIYLSRKAEIKGNLEGYIDARQFANITSTTSPQAYKD